MAVGFKPLPRHFAAEVQGLDMREPIDAAVVRIFEHAMVRDRGGP
jgi:hypothetical protein